MVGGENVRAWRALLVAGLAWWFLGCSTAPSKTAPPEKWVGSAVARAAGTEVIVLSRPTEGLVRLALVVDAGSRDADPPALATVAAIVASRRVDASFRVSPDGTEFHLECATNRIAACVATLGRALATRQPSSSEVVAAVRELRTRRLRAETKLDRRMEGLALEALFGGAASSFDPLGRDEDDRLLDAERVARFIDTHYGPTRSLLVGVGDVEGTKLVAVVNDAFRRLPSAREPRRLARGLPSGSEGARVEVGNVASAAVALVERDLAHAATLARRLVLEKERGSEALSRSELAVDVFEVRGGALVVVRALTNGDPIALAEELAFSLERLRRDPLETPPAPHPDDEAESWSAHVAGAWVARGGTPVGKSQGIGVAAVIPGGRGDRVADGDPDEALRRTANDRLLSAVKRVTSKLEPELRGRLTDQQADVVLANGARIVGRRLEGAGRVSIFVRLAGGSSEDPPSLHGRSALLAATYEAHCEAMKREGISIATRIEGTSVDLEIDFDREHARDALDRALGCLLRPSFDPSLVERARRTVLERLGPPEAAERAWAWAASILAPKSPGLIAPLGRTGTLANVRATDLLRADQELRTGARVTVGVAGDLDLRDGVHRIARRLLALPAGSPPSPPHLAAFPRSVEAASFVGPGPRVVITHRAAFDARGTTIGAEAFAAALTKTLTERPTIRVVFAIGRAEAWGAWSAIGIDLDEAALDELPSLLADARADLAARLPLEIEGRLRERRWARAHPAGLARSLVDGDPAAEERQIETARRLTAAEPAFVIGRPRGRGTGLSPVAN